MSAIAATASPSRAAQSRVRAVHARRRDRRGRGRSPVIPTAGVLIACRARKPGADRAVLPAFRRLRRLRHPALADRNAIARGSARSWSRRWRMPESPARSTTSIDAHGAGRRRITAARAPRRRRRIAQVGFAAASQPRHRRDRSIARSSIPALRRRARRRAGAGRASEADRQAARYPGHRDRAAASMSTCAAPDRCRRR